MLFMNIYIHTLYNYKYLFLHKHHQNHQHHDNRCNIPLKPYIHRFIDERIMIINIIYEYIYAYDI